MSIKNSEAYWRNLSLNITDPVQTKNKRPDTSDLEIAFLMDYLKKDDEILDIGSGSGLIINKLVDKVKSIVAVEKFEGFTKFIVEVDNMLVINADLIDFKMRKSFDSLLCFGVSQCFSKEDMQGIYANCFQMLKNNGYFIVRMQCGIEKGKKVEGFSNELGTDYFADYRHWQAEINMLQQIGFTSVERFDIFPDTLNVWPDTRHYIFVCKK
jgi:cyclopropane fatty-acyl-phospholipid synthase-like methyltransferase